MKRYLSFLTVFFFALALFILIFMGFRESYKKSYLLYGKNIEVEKELLSYKTLFKSREKSFEIEIQKIGGDDLDYFRDPPALFFDRPQFSFSGQSATWTPSPAPEELMPLFDFILDTAVISNFIDRPTRKIIQFYYRTTRLILSEEGYYYAYVFTEEEDRFRRGDLYVIDLQKGIMMAIKRGR